jgi:polyphosphate kinase
MKAKRKHAPAVISKETSWLDFNGRVLEEAADPGVPLLERLKFLGIYSNNLDEFFRVRVATLNRLTKIPKKKAISLIGYDPAKVLKQVQRQVVRQADRFERIYRQLLRELARRGVFIIDEKHMTAAQAQFVTEYFQQVVRPKLFPIILDHRARFPELKDKSIYLAVTLSRARNSLNPDYALIELPTDLLPRFVLLPQSGRAIGIIMLHFPYQSFDSISDLLREASIDPHVHSIKITLYRTAPNSSIVNALMNAVKNGKSVVAVVELQARFDEEANIHWATELQEAGAKVVFGVPGLKVHAKLCLITRKNSRGIERFAVIGTGNFNEDTARVYTDHFLLTADAKIADQVADVFEFLERNYKVAPFRSLIVFPFNGRERLTKLVEREIENAQQGKEAWILLKLNHLVDTEMITLLYRASQAGVKIRLIVRGMFTLEPGVPGLSENIEAIRLVDRFLEHTRVMFFAHGGAEKCYIASGDWMPRNLDRRVEVACPVLDKTLKQELRDVLELQWRDNAKATSYQNIKQYNGQKAGGRHRAQMEIYAYLREKNKC